MFFDEEEIFEDEFDESATQLDYVEQKNAKPILEVPPLGSVVEGTILRLEDDGICLDIGYPNEGLVPYKKWHLGANQKNLRDIVIGSKVKVMPVDVDYDYNRTNYIILSKVAYDLEAAWNEMEKKIKKRQFIEEVKVLKIIYRYNGEPKGLRVLLKNGLIGIILIADAGPDYKDLVNQEIKVYICSVSREKNLIIASRLRALKRIERDKEKVDLLLKLQNKEGAIITGSVKLIWNYGFFVDFTCNVNGFVHKVQLSPDKSIDPRKAFKYGDVVEVYLKHVDMEKQRLDIQFVKNLGQPNENE